MVLTAELVVTGLAVLAVVVLGFLLLRRALARRRQGWYAPDGHATPSSDARGAVNRTSWMLGGGGGGGGG